jgi:hypothetical protein
LNFLDDSKVLETRKRHGMVWRRYMTKDGVRVTTYEVPTSTIRSLGLKKTQDLLTKVHETYQREVRNVRIKDLLSSGWKPAAIAHEVGLTESRIRQIRKELTDGQ